MNKVFKKWIDRYLSNEEALILSFIIIGSISATVVFGEALAPVLLGIIIAYLLKGIVDTLAKKITRKKAVYSVYIGFIGIFIAFGVIGLPVLWQQGIGLLNESPRIISEIQKSLLLLPEHYPEFINEDQITAILSLISAESKKAFQWAITLSVSSIGSLITIFIYMILVPILVFFFMRDGDLFSQYISKFLPKSRSMMTRVWREMDLQLANYVRGKILEITIVGGVSFALFEIMGLNYAAILAILVGLSVIIPFIGAAIVTIPVAGVAFFQFGWSHDFMMLIGFYFLIQALDGNVLVPILFSDAVNLHPVSIIIAVLFFGSLWGVVGVIFAIPLATLIKSVVNAWPSSN